MNTLPSTHPPLAPPALAPSAARRAFTLIEVLVVISIIVILLAVSIPTIRALTKGNNEKQAVNLLTSMLTNARSTAIATHKPTGIVVYEYPPPTSGASEATSYIQLITQSSIDSHLKFRYFTRVPRTDPQQLPLGIQVATLDAGTNQFRYQTNTSNGGTCRVILFDSNGQLALYSSIAPDPSLSSDPVAVAWNINLFTSPLATRGISSPGFLVYNESGFVASHNANSANDATWLRQNADIVLINAYTGSIIR